MRLHALGEAGPTRRQFLKTAGAAATAGPKLLGAANKLASIAQSALGGFAADKAAFLKSGISPRTIQDFLFDYINDYTDDGNNQRFGEQIHHHDETIPKRAVTGYLANALDNAKDANSFVNIILTGSFPERMNNFDGMLTKAMKEATRRFGPEELGKSLTSMGQDYDSLSIMWEAALDASPDLVRAFHTTAREFARLWDDPKGGEELLRRGIVDVDTAKGHYTRVRRVQERKRWQEEQFNKDEQDEQEQRAKRQAEPEPLQKLQVPKDYELANPMHQPFESRLRRRLALAFG